jgi:trehalose 6-phosphate phosphatase
VRWLLSDDGGKALTALLVERPLLVFDFDGTLAPMVKQPERAKMRPLTEKLLEAVAQHYDVAVLSGRQRADVAARLGAVRVRWVVGNHGAEWERAEARLLNRVKRWREALEPQLFDGVRLEDKGLSLTLHYRGVADPRGTERRLRALASELDGIALKRGKRVLNLLPAGSPDKGDALRRLKRLSRSRWALYVGDDETDEDAFGVRGALSVRVGLRRTSKAKWFLHGQREIDALLERLS